MGDILVGLREKADHISLSEEGRACELCNVIGLWSQKGCKQNHSEVGQSSPLPGNKYFGQ